MLLFFFQAEDGIRDLVRSRGLGDVYKRQLQRGEYDADLKLALNRARRLRRWVGRNDPGEEVRAVSYTHLTLPTSDLV